MPRWRRWSQREFAKMLSKFAISGKIVATTWGIAMQVIIGFGKHLMTNPSKQSAAPEPARAYPPRYWWLKRIALLSALIILALGALRFWWGIKSAKLLAAEIAAFHARGEPILPEDFAAPAIPDSDNGAFYLKQAAEALDETF